MSFEVPEDRSYRESHEWVAVDAGVARVGLTDFAQDELGDIVFVEHPDIGDHLDAGDHFGTVESSKAVSDLYSPVDGEVIAVNDDLRTRPETINEDPYGDGWLLRVDLDEDWDTDHLLSAAAYRERTE